MGLNTLVTYSMQRGLVCVGKGAVPQARPSSSQAVVAGAQTRRMS